MKTIRNLIITAAGVLALASCVTSSTITTTTSPDGTVTRVENKTSAPDAASVAAASQAAGIAASVIVAEK